MARQPYATIHLNQVLTRGAGAGPAALIRLVERQSVGTDPLRLELDQLRILDRYRGAAITAPLTGILDRDLVGRVGDDIALALLARVIELDQLDRRAEAQRTT